MADKKISQLTGATTPVAGTEVLPIVQGGSTVKVSIDNLTAGKTVTASNFNGTALTASTLLATDASKNLASVTSSATTPLAGTEEAAVIQSSAAKKVTVANLTAGRAVDGLSFTATKTGNDAFIKVQNSGAGAAGAWVFIDSVDPAYRGMVVQSGGTESWVIGGYGTSELQVIRGSRASGTEVFRYLGTNDVKVSAGNLVVGTAAKGIDFSANTHAAGMTSELLNWYEEGTWTPTDASGATLTFAQANGSYTRIGRQVTAWGFVTYPATADASGVEIGGLPFTSANVDAVRGGGMIGFCDASTVSSVLTNKNGTAVKLYDSSGVQIVNSTMNNKSIYYAVTYFV